MTTEFPSDEKTGLPIIPKEVQDYRSKGKIIGNAILIAIFLGIGFGIASLIHNYGSKEDYESRLTVAGGFDLKWAFLGSFIFGIMVWQLNTYPEYTKYNVLSRDVSTNPFVYRLAAEDRTTSSAVLLNHEGDIGRYNRAHRALYHFMETSTPIVVALPWTFLIYPFPTFVLIATYCVGRMIY